MEIEKEVRFRVNKIIIEKVIGLTDSIKSKQEMLDITFGKYGFDSLAETGYICRLRKKSGMVKMEVKKRTSENEWVEQDIELKDINSGANFLKLIGFEPYLYLKRFREVRRYKSLKIFIDELDLLGDFIEIEYQDSNNAKEELEEFINVFNIKNDPQGLYGDIVKDLLDKDLDFKQKFQCGIKEIIENL